jgi:hypothetical protein
MPRLGVLELPSILQKRLVAHHDHMALTFEVQVCLIVLSPRQRFDSALGIADLQLQGLFDKRIDRLLGRIIPTLLSIDRINPLKYGYKCHSSCSIP